ncbi:VOC family protein [Streptomyces sp. NPDC057565]|uniref:VOC family protein n=1 Tax=Streptomyces sp. NPDC057565 TaxID=3346169 RepID=UPI0036CFE32F
MRAKIIVSERGGERDRARPAHPLPAYPGAKSGKNRLHLDIHVGGERRGAEVERLAGLGARVVRELAAQGGSWVAMTDPEGNGSTCIKPGVPRGPVFWSGICQVRFRIVFSSGTPPW